MLPCFCFLSASVNVLVDAPPPAPLPAGAGETMRIARIMNYALCIVHGALCIMNYALCIMHYLELEADCHFDSVSAPCGNASAVAVGQNIVVVCDTSDVVDADELEDVFETCRDFQIREFTHR